jgi:WG repeat protein
MRTWIVLVGLGACAGGVAEPPSNATRAAPPAPKPPLIDAPTDCAARVEDWKPGNHDRFSFQDPSTQRYGFKNAAGAVVIAPRLRFAYEFGPGGIAAAVDDTTRFVFLDTQGRVIARAFASDNGPDYFQEGVARIIDARGKIGYVTDRGQLAIAPTYDAAESFCHGVAEVTVDGATFVVDRRGKRVGP